VDSSGWWCIGPVSLALAELHHAVGDTDAARPLVAEAAFAAERLHDRRSLQRAQTLWAEIGAAPQPPGTQVDSARLNSLSERERTVLQLLAQGLTNPDIADRLVYSLATVRRDTITIYRKLNVSGRVAATAIAIAEGLVTDDAEHPATSDP
jgi:DNA-binding NarL/FixJ family response regulator